LGNNESRSPTHGIRLTVESSAGGFLGIPDRGHNPWNYVDAAPRIQFVSKKLIRVTTVDAAY